MNGEPGEKLKETNRGTLADTIPTLVSRLKKITIRQSCPCG